MSGAAQALEGAIQLLTKFYESPSLAGARALPLIDAELPQMREALSQLQASKDSEVGAHLETLNDYLERSTHWREGGATRHDALKVAWPAITDHMEWLEMGVAEWRSVAQANARQAEMDRATARVAINHLQAVLNKARTFDEQQAADTAARDWLASIGSDPN